MAEQTENNASMNQSADYAPSPPLQAASARLASLNFQFPENTVREFQPLCRFRPAPRP